MIKGTFRLGGDVIEIILQGGDIQIFDVSSGIITTLEGLKISKEGVIKEFPDLKDNEEWKKIGLQRLKEHIKSFNYLDDKLNYIKEELEKHGYESLYKQRVGHRPQKFK